MFLSPQGWGELCDPSLNCPIYHDTFTCKHCSRIVIVKPRCPPEEMGGLCKACMGLICGDCYAKVMRGAGCTIWEKRMEVAEAKARFNQSFEAALNGDFY